MTRHRIAHGTRCRVMSRLSSPLWSRPSPSSASLPAFGTRQVPGMSSEPATAAQTGAMEARGPTGPSKYYRARYYDPRVGRFISEDPIGFEGGDNSYAYVANRPTVGTDPYGLIDPWTACFRYGICPPPSHPPSPTPRPTPTPTPTPQPTPTPINCSGGPNAAMMAVPSRTPAPHSACHHRVGALQTFVDSQLFTACVAAQGSVPTIGSQPGTPGSNPQTGTWEAARTGPGASAASLPGARATRRSESRHPRRARSRPRREWMCCRQRHRMLAARWHLREPERAKEGPNECHQLLCKGLWPWDSDCLRQGTGP